MARKKAETHGPETHAVRVMIREVPYLCWVLDRAGSDVLSEKSGFGPGMPQLEPSNRLGPDAEVGSDEWNEAVDEYARGQVIGLLDHDYDRLMDCGAVVDVGDEPPILEDQEGYLDPATASVEELRQWIEEEKPTVNEVVQASDGQHDIAVKLLEAESAAQGGDARKGVMDGLSAVMGRSEGGS